MIYTTYLASLATLGLDPSASEQCIKLAYRRLAMQHHPDRNQDQIEHDDSQFKLVKAAYEYVSDGANRDAFTSIKRPSPKPDGQFGNGAGVRFKVVTITLEDAYCGTAIRLDTHTSLCITKGMRSGTKIHANGQVYQIDIAVHPRFKRSHDDVLIEVSITAIEAILGTTVVITKLDNTMVTAQVPSGIQPGQVICLAGHGMRNPDTPKVGDMIIRISVKIPHGLTVAHLHLVQQLDHRQIIHI